MRPAFISYVRENQREVNRLYDDLTLANIPVWLDIHDINPGTRWRNAIQQAIRDGAFFIACFSQEYHCRDSTFMEEELTTAIEELRQRPTNRVWFIPVKLNECEIPDRNIGGGETLRDIQYVSLDENWDEGIQRIIRVIQVESLSGNGDPGNGDPGNGDPGNGDPENEDIMQRGDLLARRGEIDAAIRAYSDAIEVNPDHAPAYRQRGLAYFSKGMYEQALSDCNKAAELNPEDGKVYTIRSLIHGEHGRYEQAISDCNKAAELNPGDPINIYNRGRIYTQKRENELALADYSEAIELGLQNASLYYIRGLTYRKKREYDSAIQDFDKTIELAPEHIRALYYRGEAWLHLREWSNAKLDLMDAQVRGEDIIVLFHDDYANVEDFEEKTGIQLPPDIAALLTSQ